MSSNDIKVGDFITYDGRANGRLGGTVLEIENIPPYSGEGDDVVYLHVSDAGTLAPLEDVISIARRIPIK